MKYVNSICHRCTFAYNITLLYSKPNNFLENLIFRYYFWYSYVTVQKGIIQIAFKMTPNCTRVSIPSPSSFIFLVNPNYIFVFLWSCSQTCWCWKTWQAQRWLQPEPENVSSTQATHTCVYLILTSGQTQDTQKLS